MKVKNTTTRSNRKVENSTPMPAPIALAAAVQAKMAKGLTRDQAIKQLVGDSFAAFQASLEGKPVSHIDHSLRAQARNWSTGEVLARLKHELRSAFDSAFVVGSWVWVQFSGEPAPEVRAGLSQLGFHWSPRRQAWQHPCGHDKAGVGGDPMAVYETAEAAAVA